MTRFFDDLEAQLHAAARREVGGAPGAAAAGRDPAGRGEARPGRFGWFWTGLRAAPVALAVVLTLAVVGGAFVLLGPGSGHGPAAGPSGSGPASGPSGGASSVMTPQVRRELKYIEQADRQVMSAPGCQVGNGAPAARVLHRRPGRQLLSALGVLRRPAGPKDRIGRLTTLGADVYAGYARFGRDVGGHRLYLVAARSNPAENQPPARCFTAEAAAFDRLAPSIPASLRAPTEHLQTQLLAYARVMLRPVDVVCLVDGEGGGYGSDCGETVSAIESGSGGSYTTAGPGAAGGVQVTIVPDGVATVAIRWAASNGHPARTATGTVVNNLAAIRIPGYASGGNQPEPQASSVTWRAADGRVIRNWTAPAGGAAAAYCRQHPIPCIAVLGASPSGGGGYSTSSSASATATTAAASSASHP